MEKEQWTQQIKSKPLFLHIKNSIWTIKRTQSKVFFVIKDCDHMVTLFILYQNSHQRKF